jgi:hypothetical protein
MESLPIELIEQIFCELEPSRPSLRNCALVCRAWTSVAQGRLFAKFSVSLGQLADDKIRDRLTSRAPLVRTLALHFGYPPPRNPDDLHRAFANLAICEQSMTLLDTLILDSFVITETIFQMTLQVVTSLLSRAHHLSLRSIMFEDINKVYVWLAAARRLQTLSLRMVRTGRDLHAEDTPETPRLTSITTDRSEGLVGLICKANPGISRLSISWNNEHHPPLSGICRKMGSSLTHFEVDYKVVRFTQKTHRIREG